ncbi:hypothetical protein [Burkholderia anthina]|uniref:hypothetical protein n=1 Tax=Burkholderia anthina TaxID=179879 RepID=UPI00158A6E1D|nr:hypothetical protein [Burkholderia anthina]
MFQSAASGISICFRPPFAAVDPFREIVRMLLPVIDNPAVVSALCVPSPPPRVKGNGEHRDAHLRIGRIGRIGRDGGNEAAGHGRPHAPRDSIDTHATLMRGAVGVAVMNCMEMPISACALPDAQFAYAIGHGWSAQRDAAGRVSVGPDGHRSR